MRTIIKDNLETYAKAGRHDKTNILNAVTQLTGMHRKAAVRASNWQLKALQPKTIDGKPSPTYDANRRRKPGRPRKYSQQVDVALKAIWEDYGYICAERLHPIIGESIRIMKRDGQWVYGENIDMLLSSMSIGAMKKRLLRMAKEKGLVRGISTTSSRNAAMQSVPIYYGNYADKGVDYGQLDNVVHSSNKLFGKMVYTYALVDMGTYWIIPYATYSKGSKQTRAFLAHVSQQLPWKLRGIHPDNGDEFLNAEVINHCKWYGIEITRSRPYKKNDNCNIEERNRHVIRKYAGFDRYDHPDEVVVLNELYKYVGLYQNFFQPTFKVAQKAYYVNDQGVRCRRQTKAVYDKPMTPYQRAMQCKTISLVTKNKLTKQYESLNPRALRAKIEELQRVLLKLKQQLGTNYDVNSTK